MPTIVPNATACSPGGTGFLNFFNYLTGGSVTAARTASVSYSSPIVGINVIFINGAPIVLVTSSDQPTPQGAPKVQFAGGAAGFAGKRVLWRELIP